MRDEYAERENRFTNSDIYSAINPANLFMVQSRQREVLSFLRSFGFINLSDLQILEMGSGAGGVMTEYLGFGAVPGNLYGMDLLFDRLLVAQQRLPGSAFANADGQSIPFPSGIFDLVLQYTAISSILDTEIRRDVCADMLRVLKPDGMILSYDFWINPTNRQTRGLGLSEIRSSFPGCQIDYRKITLAPPIARRLVPVSWLLSAFLEKLTIFNTHYLVAINPKK
ncbi:MAG: class I SAM-dependent methyltransferase [Chloroflexi bacterium]|nr:class I SAM-dependent methyltransferase [Chloroflexota bacterium]